MNLKAMREAGIRKHLLRGGYMLPNHLMVHMLRPVGAKKDVTYEEVCGWTRVSGLARPTTKPIDDETPFIDIERAVIIQGGNVVETLAPTVAIAALEPVLDLLDVLRLTK